MSVAENDDFFGYNVASLRQASTEPVSLPPELLKQATDESWYSDRGSVSYQDVPGPDETNRDIEFINMQIMGEQPATAEYRSLEWGKLGLLLSSVQNQLRDQTKELAETWESPSAKQIFLDKVGMTLAYLDVWHEAATANSYALVTLAQVMREAQDEMRDLYREYQDAMANSITQESLNRQQAQRLPNPAREKAVNYDESGPPSTQGGEQWRAEMREGMRTKDENKANYDRWARELASRVAERYTPVIHRLESGRARKMTPLNAVNHPGAYGTDMPQLPPLPGMPPGGPPGGPGEGPGPAPDAPPAPPPNPDGLKDKLDDKLDGKNPPGLKDKPDLPDAPNTPDPTALPTPPPIAPTMPAPVLPTQNVIPRGPNLSPQTVTALNNTLNQLGLNNPATSTLNASDAARFTARAPSLQNGMYPPGSIPPPPGGIPNQPKQQGKVLGQRPGMTPPPGGQTRAPEAARQQKSAPGTEVPQAFQPPPPTSAPVLDNKQRKRTRPGSGKETPTAQETSTPGVTPPVLANPHRGAGPTRTYSEQRADRRARRQQRQAEIAAGVSTGTAPVLGGRFDQKPEVTAEAPITLRGREQVAAAPDQHARPAVHADRTARRKAEPVTEQSTWEVETPGGPVVAGTEEKQQKYRPEPPNALGAR